VAKWLAVVLAFGLGLVSVLVLDGSPSSLRWLALFTVSSCARQVLDAEACRADHVRLVMLELALVPHALTDGGLPPPLWLWGLVPVVFLTSPVVPATTIRRRFTYCLPAIGMAVVLALLWTVGGVRGIR
jgi:hypothetical protein